VVDPRAELRQQTEEHFQGAGDRATDNRSNADRYISSSKKGYVGLGGGEFNSWQTEADTKVLSRGSAVSGGGGRIFTEHANVGGGHFGGHKDTPYTSHGV